LFISPLKLVLTLHDFRIWPNHQIVYERASALIYCASTVPTTWTFHRIKKEKYFIPSNSLFLYYIPKKDEGLYVCHGKHISGKKFRAKAVIVVQNIKGSS